MEHLRRLVSVYSHPLRSRLLIALSIESPLGADVLAERTGTSLQQVRRHLNALLTAGFVKVDREETRRGVVKRYFGLDAELSFGISEDELLSERDRRRQTVGVIRAILEEATQSASSALLVRRHDRLVANVPGRVDERGWRELSELHHEMLDRAVTIVAQSRQRLEESGAEAIGVISEQILLEAPQHAPGDRG